MQKVAGGSRLWLCHPTTENSRCQPSSKWISFSNQGRIRQRNERDGLRLLLLCARYTGTLTVRVPVYFAHSNKRRSPTAPYGYLPMGNIYLLYADLYIISRAHFVFYQSAFAFIRGLQAVKIQTISKLTYILAGDQWWSFAFCSRNYAFVAT